MNNYKDLEEYIENEYISLNDINGELFECMGGHVWHVKDIELEWDRLNKKNKAKFNYSEMLYKCGVTDYDN